MGIGEARPYIPESFLEYRHIFATPWIDRWTTPNPFVSPILATLRPSGVELADFTLNHDAANVAAAYLDISIRKLGAVVRIGLDTVTFGAANPAWEMAPALVQVFDQVSACILDVLGVPPESQEATLAFHVTPGTLDFGSITASLVNKDVVGDCDFYGVSLHRSSGTVVIDKSLKYEGAAFVRVQHVLAGQTSFADAASRLYDEEVNALRLLGIQDVPKKV